MRHRALGYNLDGRHLNPELGTASDVSSMFASVMTGLEELRQDMTKKIEREKERAQQGHEMF